MNKQSCISCQETPSELREREISSFKVTQTDLHIQYDVGDKTAIFNYQLLGFVGYHMGHDIV